MVAGTGDCQMAGMSENSGQWLRYGGVAAIGAGAFGITFEVLGFLSHGPTGDDQKIPVFGLLNADYQRLLVVSGVLTICGLVALYKHQKTRLGRLGRPGFLLLVGACTLALTAQILDYLVFPNPDPRFGMGFFLIIFIVGPLLLVGWMFYGIASIRGSITPTWCRYIPFVLCGAILFVIVDVALGIMEVSLPFPLHSGLWAAVVSSLSWIAYGAALIGAWANKNRSTASFH